MKSINTVYSKTRPFTHCTWVQKFNWLKSSIKRKMIKNTGARALDRIQNTTFDLALLDLHLPDESGLEVAKGMRERGFNSLLYAFTSADCTRRMDMLYAAGFSGWLLKDFIQTPLRELPNAVFKILSDHTQRLTVPAYNPPKA